MVINVGLAILKITKVTRNHYGTYYVWTDNAYGGWKKDDLGFILASTSNNHNNYLYVFLFKSAGLIILSNTYRISA